MRIFILTIFCFNLLFPQNGKWNFRADGELEEYQANNITINKLTDNVHVFNDSMSLKTNLAYNYKEIGELHLYGNTIMVSSNDTLTCDSMIYWMNNDSLFAFGNVELKQKDRILNSKILNFWKTNGYRGSSFIASENVSIFDSARVIKANNIHYYDLNQKMILENNASVTSNNREIFGDFMNLQFNDSLITFIKVNGNGRAYNTIYAKVNKDFEETKKFIDIMLGNFIDITFTNNNIKTILLDRMALTRYHAIDSNLLIGVNTVDGDLITLGFINDELNRINVQGDARGNFIPEPKNSNIDSTIIYKAENIDYYIDTKESYLNNLAEIEYQNMSLESNYVHIDWNNNTLNAIKRGDKLPLVKTDAGDPMRGDSLKYNLLDRHGIIYKGKTKVDDAYYHGDEIYRDDPNLYHVVSSKYTSCDLDHPHYSFYSNHMKMIPGDKIIAKPLILKIFDFPIIGIPFAVLPNKGGSRHSGWIMPSFGFDNFNGSTMNELGYYWAPNDYWDSKLLINFADRIGFWVRNTSIYKLRYKIDGRIDVKFVRKLNNTEHIESISSDSTTQEYEINFSHSQKIDPTQNFKLKYNYVSNYAFHRNTALDPIASLDKQLSKSSLTYSNTWPEQNNLVSFSLTNTHDLKKQELISYPPEDSTKTIFPIVRNSFPGISFAHTNSAFFGDGDRWYNSLQWSFSSNHVGYYKKGVYVDDNYVWKDTLDYKNGINTRLQFAYPQKIFKWLNITPRIKLKEDWIFKYRKYNESLDNFSINNGLKRRFDLEMSMIMNTKIYGIFPINIVGAEALRHIITPTIGLSYKPNITKPIMGYNINSFDFTNDGELLDPFYGSALSPTSEKEKLFYNIKLQNLFQIKYNKNDEIEKFDILDWIMGTSYDALADSINWAPLKSKIKSKILGLSNININLTHDLYKLYNGGRINKYENELYGMPIPYLTKMDISTSVSLSGKRLIGFETDSLNNQNFISNDSKLWSSSFRIQYKKQRKYDGQIMNWDEKFQLNTSISLHISNAWKLSYKLAFDLIEQTMGGQSFVFTRDLHCWKFSFKWIPGRNYFLHIYVKKPELKDIKLESRSKKENNNFFN